MWVGGGAMNVFLGEGKEGATKIELEWGMGGGRSGFGVHSFHIPLISC